LGASVDGLYLGDVRAGATVVNTGSSTSGSDLFISQVIVYKSALTDQQIAAVTNWLTQVPNGDPGDAWRLKWFGSPNNSGDAADELDFDGGGSVNLQERAFLTDPTDGSDDYYLVPDTIEDSGQNYLAVTYRRLAGGTGSTGINYTADGITYTIEHDIDLADSWDTGGITVVSVTSNGDGSESVTIRLNTSIPSSSRQFIRLRVTSAP